MTTNEPRYQRGKVYKLISSKNNDIYIGSTCCLLSRRMSQHKAQAKYRPLPVHKYFNEIGWDKVSIILIEDIPCDNKNQLVRAEQRHIDLLKPVLNKQAAFVFCPHGRTHAQCKDCKGSQICLHNRIKSSCKDCKGSQVCPHNKRKLSCKACAGDKYKCSTCDKLYCSNKSLMAHYLSKRHQRLVEANNEEKKSDSSSE